MERKSRRRRAALFALTFALVAFVVAMNVVNRIETEIPEPLWSVATFDVPRAEDNGFTLIAHYHSTTISGIDCQPIDNLLDASRNQKLSELPRVFSPARSAASKIKPHTATCTEGFTRDRMVIPCLEIEEGACSAESLDICTRLVTFSALDLASRGSAAGVRKMSDVLDKLNDAAVHSPHPWVQARCIRLLRGAIHHSAAVIKWRRVNTRTLRQAVERIALPMESLVTSSYLLKHAVLRDGMAKTETWLLDECDVMRGLNAPF